MFLTISRIKQYSRRFARFKSFQKISKLKIVNMKLKSPTKASRVLQKSISFRFPIRVSQSQIHIIFEVMTSLFNTPTMRACEPYKAVSPPQPSLLCTKINPSVRDPFLLSSFFTSYLFTFNTLGFSSSSIQLRFPCFFCFVYELT